METETIFFNPDKHPNDTWKAFKQFCNRFELRYSAQFTDPPKTALDSAIQRWKLEHPPTEHVANPMPTVDEFDAMKEQWKSRDKIAKVLGMFSSERLFNDWEIALQDETARVNATWNVFKTTMEIFYKPTENPTLNNYHFRSMSQQESESFASFCIRVEKEGKTCSFKCHHNDCSAETVAVRDQIIIGTTNSKIREEALLKSWDLNTLRTEGTKLESASKSDAEISGGVVNRIGKYSFSSLKRNNNSDTMKRTQSSNSRSSGLVCFNCGEHFKGPAFKHNGECKAKNMKCNVCGKTGHVEKCCRRYKVNHSEAEQDEVSNRIYNVNIFKVNVFDRNKFVTNKKGSKDFKVEVVINGAIATVTADTGARVSVCGKVQAQRWNLLQRMVPTSVRIKPYNSPAVPTKGMARCSVTFGITSVPVEWYILDGTCEPILSGSAAVNLGIIYFKAQPPVFKPINMVKCELNANNQELIQNILAKRPENFSHTIGKHKSYKVKLHIDTNVKPVVTPPRPTPYHLKDRINKALNDMIKNDVIEEHPVGEPTPWISNAVYVPKPDGSLRVTLDARNINKAIISSNLPIPRQEDIKAKLTGARIFSKLDFRKAFWQLELQPESRSLTVFNMNDKLYRYKRLIMGVKSSQGELNAALSPLFRNIPDAHLIHDDLIIASSDMTNHLTVVTILTYV